MLFIEGYFEFLISGYLNANMAIKEGKFGDHLGYIFGFLSLIMTLVIAPILSIWVLSRPLELI